MEEKLEEIMKILKIVECKSQKIKKEQTECKSECSSNKVDYIVKELEILQNIFIEIR